jgi:hypothetical protein
MTSAFLRSLVFIVMSLPLLAWSQSAAPAVAPKSGGDFADVAQPLNRVPEGVLLVKGAWSSASDSVTPVPEDGIVAHNFFANKYFGMDYPLPSDWEEKYKGPPPSDSGLYVLLQLRPAATFKGSTRGTILMTAQDLFFTPLPANHALDLVNYSKNHLRADYKVEMPPTPTKIADRPFTFFAYWSPAAELHWYVLATEIRCHAVQIVLSSRDTKLLESLVLDLSKMKLPSEVSPTAGSGGDPVCIKDYASDQNVITQVEPIFTDHKFNPVPVRIIIDKQGKVKHIHFLSAFPDQTKAITDVMSQWKFKPYLRDGKPVEVETGIMFGRGPRLTRSASATPTTE